MDANKFSLIMMWINLPGMMQENTDFAILIAAPVSQLH